MIELLCSNYIPLKISGKRTFEDVFFDNLGVSKSVKIASGYISNDSIASLISIYDKPLNLPNLTLIVGMHYFDGFTKPQYNSLDRLNKLLKKNKRGQVYVSTVSRYHGKIYSFKSNNDIYSTILGSSNLTQIDTSEKIYESDVYVSNDSFCQETNKFIDQLKSRYCEPFEKISSPRIIQNFKLFNNHTNVYKVPELELKKIKQNLTSTSFDILLKDSEKSNLNVFFGKGRKQKNGFVAPRNWYEVELIVSKNITSHKDYPKKGRDFYVITDDGYKFKCKVSGDFSKNFRSAEDLTILGKWIKGRLEIDDSLKVGDKVTKNTFKNYGRNSIKMTQTKDPNIYYLDFKN